jgi:small neutral amino acid transporter SnatA (MarC family)
MRREERRRELNHAVIVATILLLLFAIIATRLVLGQSDRLFDIMGVVGTEVLSRVIGIIVAAIAIEFIGTGIIGMYQLSLV